MEGKPLKISKNEKVAILKIVFLHDEKIFFLQIFFYELEIVSTQESDRFGNLYGTSVSSI